jgi:hypothetical protein
MDHPAALHRINVGVPATVEHSSEAGPETGKWVAETTQVSIRKPTRLSIDCSHSSLIHSELYHFHGCAAPEDVCEGSIASYSPTTHDWLRAI